MNIQFGICYAVLFCNFLLRRAIHYSVLRKFGAEYISCQIMKVKKGLTCSSKIGKEKEIGKWVFEAMGAQGQEGVTDILGGRSRSQRAEKMFFGGEFSPVCEIEGVRGSRQLKSAFGPLTQPTLKSKGTTTSLTTFTHLSQ